MTDTPKDGETGSQAQLKNDAPKPTTPLLPEEKKTDDGEIEAARKRAEQAEMRANQLANQLKAKEDAEAAAKARELEEQNEFKTLYEQEKAKREQAEHDAEAAEQQKALADAREKVLSEFSDEVKAAAKDLGVELASADENTVAEFKGKLDKLQTRLGVQRVTPNNPGTPSPKSAEPTGEELRQILMDPQKRDEYYRKKDGVTAMMMEPPRA
jgi:hypothetical protein